MRAEQVNRPTRPRLRRPGSHRPRRRPSPRPPAWRRPGPPSRITRETPAMARRAPVSCRSEITAGRMSSETRFITLIIGFSAGPAVSLNGSPTVSPMTAALWASEPLPPSLPSSMYFLALSHAPPEFDSVLAMSCPVRMVPARKAPEREVVDAEADDDRGQDGQQGRRGQLALGRRRADADDPPVLGLLGVVHDARVLAELAAHLEHDGAGRAADGPDGQRREEEGDRPADEQADEGRRVGHVDLGER